MFEFHGWLTVRVDDHDDADGVVLHEREQAAESLVRQLMADCRDNFSVLELHRSGNGLVTLAAHGLRNHRQGWPMSLFEAVSKALPGSYGVLYYHDDEHVSEDNIYKVMRFARGESTLFDDQLLSPVVPIIESSIESPGEQDT